MSVGLTFRETMAGPFALGAVEPEAGKAQGKALDTDLALHCQVVIEDVDRFVDDPNHGGELRGSVDFTPYGEGLPGVSGTVNLLAPSQQADRKRMGYDLAFEHEGQPYYLAGEKHIENASGLDLWKDTTTLFTRLHQGTDTSGPVVGAGVLSLGPVALIKLLSTVRTTGAESARERAYALETFGSFFMGGLWKTYGPLVTRAQGGES